MIHVIVVALVIVVMALAIIGFVVDFTKWSELKLDMQQPRVCKYCGQQTYRQFLGIGHCSNEHCRMNKEGI